MLIQKLYKNGNSVAVTVPKEHLRQLGLRDGTQVEVDVVGEKWIMVPKKSFTKAKKIKEEDVSQEFKKWLKETLEEDAEILDELENR